MKSYQTIQIVLIRICQNIHKITNFTYNRKIEITYTDTRITVNTLHKFTCIYIKDYINLLKWSTRSKDRDRNPDGDTRTEGWRRSEKWRKTTITRKFDKEKFVSWIWCWWKWYKCRVYFIIVLIHILNGITCVLDWLRWICPKSIKIFWIYAKILNIQQKN